MQEMSPERDHEIPDQVRDIYKQWRPSPLFRARRLEAALDELAPHRLVARDDVLYIAS